MPRSRKHSGNNIEIRDSYTCFVISDHVSGLKVDKFHFCSWWYRKPLLFSRKVLIEIGLQVRISDLNVLKKQKDGKALKIAIVAPWISDGDQVEDVYPAIKEKKNARFIFNEDVTRDDTFDGGDGLTGCILNFVNPICALPAEYQVSEGKVDLTVKIPEECDLKKYPIYVRFAILAKRGRRICYANTGPAKGIYAFDLKINQPRNLPAPYKKDQLCEVGKSYCIHIVPSHYQISYYGGGPSLTVRLLEHTRYNEYVKGMVLFDQDIKPNAYQVVFNKREDLKNMFFTVFESEHIGMVAIGIAFLINIICTLMFLPLGQFRGNTAGLNCAPQRLESIRMTQVQDPKTVDSTVNEKNGIQHQSSSTNHESSATN